MKWKIKYSAQAFEDLIVLYLPKEDLQTVNVVRIIYGGRDINKQLEETKEILGQD